MKKGSKVPTAWPSVKGKERGVQMSQVQHKNMQGIGRGASGSLDFYAGTVLNHHELRPHMSLWWPPDSAAAAAASAFPRGSALHRSSQRSHRPTCRGEERSQEVMAAAESHAVMSAIHCQAFVFTDAEMAPTKSAMINTVP